MDPDYPQVVCVAQSRRAAAKQVTDTIHDARVGCVRRWYAEKRKLPMRDKSPARDILMEPWQYMHVICVFCLCSAQLRAPFTNMCILCMQVPPPFVGHARPGVYQAMVHWWTSAGFKRRHIAGQLKRAAMIGGSHTQGSMPMTVIMQNKVRKGFLLTLLIMMFLIPQIRPS
jgi:hypothetical protein